MENKISSVDVDDIQPYGAYFPKGRVKNLIALMRNSFLGRGEFRRLGLRYLKNNVSGPVDAEVLGFQGRFYTSGNNCEVKALVAPKRFNRAEFDFIKRFLDNGSVFVDIGANVGLFSLYAAQLGLKGSSVLAIEPHPIVFRRLKFNVQLNGFHNVQFQNFAVGATSGQLELNYNVDQLGTSSLSSVADEKNCMVEVEVRPLLELLIMAGVSKIDILKIDIEGYEDHALIPFFSTAHQDLWPRHVIIEHVEQENWETNCIDHMQRLGYKETLRTRNNLCLTLDR